jgi:hypothetical protein
VFPAISNVLHESKQQQVVALGRLGWSLRRIEATTAVRRETISGYLKAAGVAVRRRGAGRRNGRRQIRPPRAARTGRTPPAARLHRDARQRRTATPPGPPPRTPSQVDHLLTHTSGVRDWPGLLPLAEEGVDVMTLILRQRGLNFTPGEEWSYSNSGYELAKEIVARVSGMSSGEFARRRLFEPLGMRSEYVPDILRGTGDRALAYQKDGAGWKEFMRLGNRRAGGALIANAGDLLIWNEALTTGVTRRRFRWLRHLARPLHGVWFVTRGDVQFRAGVGGNARHPGR